MPPLHHLACECSNCWRRRRQQFQPRQIRGTAQPPAAPPDVEIAGIGVPRPERREAFSLPNSESGLLLALGFAGSMVIANRIHREAAKGVKLDEMFDGVIMGMALYAALEHMRNIHNRKAG
jgi:hypothetical protein